MHFNPDKQIIVHTDASKVAVAIEYSADSPDKNNYMMIRPESFFYWMIARITIS
ncbi:hypothetical protein VTO42DRAFT_9013 [Malbranchea cinnamomea]